MADAAPPTDWLAAIRAGGAALDRGLRGPAQELAILRRAGWLEIDAVPEPGEECERLMALASASLPLARLYEGHCNALHLMAGHATPGQRARVAEALAGGGLAGVWGADGPHPVTLADGPDPVLCGTKAYASGLGEVRVAVVTAATPAGLQMVLVEPSDPDRADHGAWDVDGMVGSQSGRFVCDGLPAGPAQRLGPPGALFAEPSFHGGVWRLAACYAGGMARIATLCAEQVRNLPTDNALAIARLGGIAIEAQTAALWARHAARMFADVASAPDQVIAAALFAREATEAAAIRLLAAAERLLGARMHARGHEAGRIARDLRLFLRQADCDGKLALATGCWLQAPERPQLAPGMRAAVEHSRW